MTLQRVQCSGAPRWRDRHMATDRQYHLTDPDGRQLTFCSACCLLSYAIYGLPADVEATAQGGDVKAGQGGAKAQTPESAFRRAS